MYDENRFSSRADIGRDNRDDKGPKKFDGKGKS